MNLSNKSINLAPFLKQHVPNKHKYPHFLQLSVVKNFPFAAVHTKNPTHGEALTHKIGLPSSYYPILQTLVHLTSIWRSSKKESMDSSPPSWTVQIKGLHWVCIWHIQISAIVASMFLAILQGSRLSSPHQKSYWKQILVSAPASKCI